MSHDNLLIHAERKRKGTKILSREDFGHVLGNASRFSSTQANLLLTAEKKKWALTTYIFTSKAEKLFWTLIFGTGFKKDA